MPGGDGTGPVGRGPMTGRALGYCAGYDIPGYTNHGFGRGFGRGLGRGSRRSYWGRGRGFWRRGYVDPYWQHPYFDFYQQPSKDEEKSYLEDMIKSLEEEMKRIRERLQELSKEKNEASR